MNNIQKGRQGEDAALLYLAERGAQLVARNFRTPYGEIDLIVRRDGVLCFVEVKRRTRARYGLPAEAVTKAKQQRIVKTASLYLQANGGMDQRCRFDVVEVYPDRIHLIEGAFTAG